LGGELNETSRVGFPRGQPGTKHTGEVPLTISKLILRSFSELKKKLFLIWSHESIVDKQYKTYLHIHITQQ